MLTFQQNNALGQILNSTWGRGTDDTFRCKAHMQDDQLVITYSTIVFLANETAMSIQAPALVDESNSRINDLIAHTKKEFKNLTGESLPLKEVSNTDSWEMMQASNLNPRRVAKYRRKVLFRTS